MTDPNHPGSPYNPQGPGIPGWQGQPQPPQPGQQPPQPGQQPPQQYGAAQPPAGPPPGGGQPTGFPVGGGSPQQQGVGFFKALFDFSFTHFVTPMIVKFVYIIATVALVLGWLIVLVTAFAQSAGAGVTVLILGPIMLIVYLAFIRMTLEFYLAVVRMSEDIHQRLR